MSNHQYYKIAFSNIVSTCNNAEEKGHCYLSTTQNPWINAKEACALVDAGFEYVTGEYNDGGKIFRKPKCYA